MRPPADTGAAKVRPAADSGAATDMRGPADVATAAEMTAATHRVRCTAAAAAASTATATATSSSRSRIGGAHQSGGQNNSDTNLEL
jgi:hypothetical protein